MHFQPLVIYLGLYYSLRNHDKIRTYFNSKIQTSTSFFCAFWFPRYILPIQPSSWEKELLHLFFGPSMVNPWTAFFCHLPPHISGKLGREGGRVCHHVLY